MKISEIGRIKNDSDYLSDHFKVCEEESRIVIYDEFIEGLYGIVEWEYLQVIFGSPPSGGRWHKCLTDCGKVRGVFATRSPIRPSNIDLATVQLLELTGNTLRVKGLNAADGSPVYDLKPFIPLFDAASLEDEKVEQLKRDPRSDFLQALYQDNRVRCLVKTAEIHGHFCPGSALGVMASLCGLRQLGLEAIASDGLEDLMAVVEINACFADGVQAVSGCTLGNNALVYRDLGKHAVTFAVRGNNEGIRVRVRTDFCATIRQLVPDFYPLMDKVIKNRQGTAEEEAAFKEKGREAAFALVQLSFEELLITETVRPVLPDYAPITENVTCPGCGEAIMVTKTVSEGRDRRLCFMCAGRTYRQVEGQGIVEKGRNDLFQ